MLGMLILAVQGRFLCASAADDIRRLQQLQTDYSHVCFKQTDYNHVCLRPAKTAVNLHEVYKEAETL